MALRSSDLLSEDAVAFDATGRHRVPLRDVLTNWSFEMAGSRAAFPDQASAPLAERLYRMAVGREHALPASRAG